MSKTNSADLNDGLSLSVNGAARRVPEGSTIADLLEDLGIVSGKVAVEHNRAIAPRSAYGSTSLKDGDVLEIVRFVGGG